MQRKFTFKKPSDSNTTPLQPALIQQPAVNSFVPKQSLIIKKTPVENAQSNSENESPAKIFAKLRKNEAVVKPKVSPMKKPITNQNFQIPTNNNKNKTIENFLTKKKSDSNFIEESKKNIFPMIEDDFDEDEMDFRAFEAAAKKHSTQIAKSPVTKTEMQKPVATVKPQTHQKISKLFKLTTKFNLFPIFKIKFFFSKEVFRIWN